MASGSDEAICCTGSIGQTVLHTIDVLREKGISAGAYSFTSLAPFDADTVSQLSEQVRLLVTVEDHNRNCGLGSMIAGILAEKTRHAPLLTIGTDGFAAGYGTQDEMRGQNGLTSVGIAEKILKRWEDIV